MSVNTSRPPWKGVLRSWSCMFGQSTLFGHSSCVTTRAKQGTRPLYSVLTFRTFTLPGHRPKQASPQSPDCSNSAVLGFGFTIHCLKRWSHTRAQLLLWLVQGFGNTEVRAYVRSTHCFSKTQPPKDGSKRLCQIFTFNASIVLKVSFYEFLTLPRGCSPFFKSHGRWVERAASFTRNPPNLREYEEFFFFFKNIKPRAAANMSTTEIWQYKKELF